MSRSFILVIFIELSKKNEQLYCYNAYISHINAHWTLRHSWTVQSLLLGKNIFAFKQLVNLLQIGAIVLSYLLFYWWFWYRTSSWLTIIQKLGSENQQKRSYWPWKFFKVLIKHKETRTEHQHHSLTMLKTISNANDVLTEIFVQCRPGFHMLSLIC